MFQTNVLSSLIFPLIALVLANPIEASAKTVTHAQKNLLSCIRGVVQEARFYGYSESPDSEALDGPGRQFLEVLSDLGDKGTGLVNDREVVSEKLRLCREIRAVRIGYQSKNNDRGLWLAIYRLVKSSGQMNQIGINLTDGMLRDFEDSSVKRCSGAVLSVAAAVAIGVTGGVGTHVCRFSDGRSGLFVGLHGGWMMGAGAIVSIITQDEAIAESRNLTSHEYLTVPLSIGVGVEIDDGGGIGGGTVGAMFGKKLLVGGEVKVLPLGTNWKKLVGKYF